MHDYVRQHTAKLLRRLAYEVNRATRNADEETVHDLRVAIRRLRRCLQVFAQLYPVKSWKKVRRRLSDLMDLAGAVRDRDIAGRLLAEASVPRTAAAYKLLGTERQAAVKELTSGLKRWKSGSYFRKWRTQLGL